MVHKTRKHKHTAVKTIPQLRRLFEHIEEFVDSRIASKQSKESLSKELRREWKQLFVKDLDKKAADTFIENRMKQRRTLRATRKHRGGATQGVIQGAPLDHTMRQGVYLAPNSIPSEGHLPLSREQTGGSAGFGSYIDYVNQGFWNPEQAKTYDPIPGQQPFPVPYADTGSNAFVPLKGGSRRNRRRIRGVSDQRGGDLQQSLQATGALITQAFQRPFASNAPATIFQDAESKWYGQQAGSSPDQVQRHVSEVHARYTPPSL